MSNAQTRKQLAVALIVALAGLAPAALPTRVRSSSKTAFTQDTAQVVGNWTGASLCQVKNSPCHDEKVVYHISQGKEPNVLTITADKIVDGKAITMGTIDYTYDRKKGAWLNETAGRVWELTVQGKKMEATLTMPDKTIYRRVSLKKEE